MFHDLLQDVRYAVRSLLSAPAFTLVCVLILTLGIGASAIVFTLVDTLLLTPPPGIHAPEEMVRVTRTHEQSRSGAFSYPDWVYLRDHSETLAGIAAFQGDTTAAGLTRRPGDDPVRVEVTHVSASFFDVLGVPLAHGRAFRSEEGAVGSDGRVLVAAHSFWRSGLGADPGVVGAEIRLNGEAFRLVGVAADGFRGPGPLASGPDLWVPVTAQPLLLGDGEAWLRRVPNQRINWLSSVARLAPGVSIEQARAELDQLAERLEAEFPDDAEGLGIGVFARFGLQPSTHDELLGLTRLLGTVVAMVLLIVCANIAVLQLARGSARQPEVAIRVALGAGRGRIVRQLIVESLLLSLAGALAGFVLAFQGSRMVGAWLPVGGSVEYRPDAGVLLFSLAIAVLAAVAFGLAPAFGVARRGARSAMRGRSIAGGRSLTRSALVVAQVAISLVLVLGACLFVRSLIAAESVDPGFATEGRVFVWVFTGTLGYTQDELNVITDEIRARVQAGPMVESASLAVMTPFLGKWTSGFDPTGGDDDDPTVEAYMNAVGPGYFSAMGIPLLAGREFEAGDRDDGDSVVIVNEAAAEMIWPGENPVGKTLALFGDEATDRVIGMVASVNTEHLGEEPLPQMYVSAYQSSWPRVAFVASTSGPTPALSRFVQEQILAVDPSMTIARVDSVEEAIESQVGTYRLGARALGTFAVLAALLAAVGLYGVLSFLVAAGTREIGIRMALGATEHGVLRWVVGRGLRIALLGVGLGLVAAFLSARLLSGMLYGIDAHDPVSFILVPLLLEAVAIGASLLPGLRAARVDPMEALRAE